jgi:hypothetical protein
MRLVAPLLGLYPPTTFPKRPSATKLEIPQSRSGQLKKRVMKEATLMAGYAIAAVLGNKVADSSYFKALDNTLIQPHLPPLEEVLPVLRIPDALGDEGNVALVEESLRGASHAKSVQEAVESLPLNVGVEFHSVHKDIPLSTTSFKTFFEEAPAAVDKLVTRIETIDPKKTQANVVNISMGITDLSRQIALLDATIPRPPLPPSNGLVKENPYLFDKNPKTGLSTINPQKVLSQSEVYIQENKRDFEKVEAKLAQQVATLKKHNIPVFIASGNDNEDVVAYQKLLGGTPVPERMVQNKLQVPGVIVVGASKPDGSLTSYSSHYRGVRYTAPMPKDTLEKGTSFSTPQVAAAGAYLIEEKNYTVDEMLQYLDDIGKPMKTEVNGVSYPYTFLPFDRQMISDLRNAPTK